jgi:hypothetical protein
MKTYGNGGIAPPFLTSSLNACGQFHVSVAFTAGKTAPSTHYIESWMGPRSSLGLTEKRIIKGLLPLIRIEPRLLVHPARSLVALPTELFRLFTDLLKCAIFVYCNYNFRTYASCPRLVNMYTNFDTLTDVSISVY